ncbi:MAG: hypothetical protein J0L94_05400 [Rhodothermia bacterium]|nr:hypothetical protein [Rhodothermia bacterium]
MKSTFSVLLLLICIWSQVHAQTCAPTAVKTIRASTSPKHERLVFEFYGQSVPEIVSLSYAKPPFIGPSGEPEKINGKFFVEAFWHTPMEDCNVLKKQLNFPVLRGVLAYDVFEGDIRYIISLNKKVTYSIMKLTNPGRLVIDFEKK